MKAGLGKCLNEVKNPLALSKASRKNNFYGKGVLFKFLRVFRNIRSRIRNDIKIIQ